MERNKMKGLKRALLLVCLGLFMQEGHCQERRGYMFVAPKQLHEGSNETMCIMFSGLESSEANVTLTLYNDKNESVSTNNFNVTNTGLSSWHCISDFYVPSISLYTAYLNLRVLFPGHLEYEVDETKLVGFPYTSSSGDYTFLETDKDIYKYGQDVKFRILSMDDNNKPLTDTIPEVWIEDPGLNRVAQWRNVSMEYGLTQLSYSLSQDPPQGTWTITVKSIYDEKSVTFEVAEYVLPKFTLNIKGQRDSNAIYSTDKNYTWTICAKYTHGEGVTGTMNVTFAKTSYRFWPHREQEENSTIILEGHKFSGCEEVTLTNETYGSTPNQYEIELRASVEEEGTSIIVNASSDHYLSANYENIINDQDKYFKPGLFFHGELSLKDVEQAGIEGRDFQMCVQYIKKTCKNFTSGAEGKFPFTILPIPQQEFNSTVQRLLIHLQVSERNESGYSQPRQQTYSSPVWYSNAYKFIELRKQKEGDKLKCNKTYEMELFYTPPPQQVTASIAVMSSGRIVRTTSIVLGPDDPKATVNSSDNVISLTNEAEVPDVLRKTFPLETSVDVSERFNILVHYTLEDGEVIATGRDFDVDTCLQHKVTLRWSKSKPLPGEDIDLRLQAAPRSICGVSVVDRSVKLLSSKNQFEKADLLNRTPWLHLFQHSHPTQQRDWEYCQKKSEDGDSKVRNKRSFIGRPFYGSNADSITAFDIAGLIVMTDVTLETRPCNNRFYFELDRRPVPVAAVAPPSSPDAENKVVESSFSGVAQGGGGSREDTTRIRQEFPETWLFDLEYMGDADVKVKQHKVPDTITEWVGSAFCLSSSEGLGMSEEASFISFTPFFIDYNLPYSVKRGEIFELKVTVFNYLDISAPVMLKLQQSSEYEVSDGVYNKTVEIPPNRSKVITYQVTATSLGDVNITSFAYLSPENDTDPTYANISLSSDAIRRALLVEPEGFPQEKHQVEFMCIQDGAQVTKLLNCSPPATIVPDSAKTTYSVTGDLMGPLLTNLDSFIRFPTGCGEQNMATLVPNIHALTYLDSIRASEPELRQKSIEHMKAGYQRQLRYKHQDGSYSAFGPNSRTEIGSIWLTAFVLKSFSQAKPYIYIDEKIVNQSKAFIFGHQMKDGCFQKVGEVFHRAMKGGVGRTNDTKVLTAYIITALLEAGEDPASERIISALQCIKDMPDTPYAHALAAYAFMLSIFRSGLESVAFLGLGPKAMGETFLLALLQTAKKEAQLMWWEEEAGCTYCRDSNIEIAGYALMAFLLSDPTGWSNTRPIARYLISQRNTHGAFYSTQDTVVALEALTKYAMQAEEVPLKEVTVNCEACNPTVTNTVNTENRLISSKASVGESLNGNVVAQGHGCVIAQCSIKYNIPEAQPKVAFDLKTSSWSLDGPSQCQRSELHMCISYVLDTQKSNMAVVEISMASGYKPDRSSLYDLLNDIEIDLKRFDEEDNIVNLYFDYFDQNQKCFSIKMDQENVVTNPKPANVKVYDYYQTELTTSTSYSICNDTPTTLLSPAP